MDTEKGLELPGCQGLEVPSVVTVRKAQYSVLWWGQQLKGPSLFGLWLDPGISVVSCATDELLIQTA